MACCIESERTRGKRVQIAFNCDTCTITISKFAHCLQEYYRKIRNIKRARARESLNFVFVEFNNKIMNFFVNINDLVSNVEEARRIYDLLFFILISQNQREKNELN